MHICIYVYIYMYIYVACSLRGNIKYRMLQSRWVTIQSDQDTSINDCRGVAGRSRGRWQEATPALSLSLLAVYHCYYYHYVHYCYYYYYFY